MILREIRDYLRQRGRAPLRDMAIHFDMDESALRGALEHWIRKGRVRRLPPGTTCFGCSSCAPQDIELYEWVEADGVRPLQFVPQAVCPDRDAGAGTD